MDISYRDNHRTFTAAVGERIVLRLPETASTGYRWMPESVPTGLTLDSDEYDNDGAIGAAATRVLRWTARHPGTFDLRLLHRRDWETDRPPLDTVQFRIIVKAAR